MWAAAHQARTPSALLTPNYQSLQTLDLVAMKDKLLATSNALEKFFADGQLRISGQHSTLVKEIATQKALIAYLRKGLEDVHHRLDEAEKTIGQLNARISQLEQAILFNTI